VCALLMLMRIQSSSIVELGSCTCLVVSSSQTPQETARHGCTSVTPKIPILEFERGSPKDVIDKDHHIHENTFLEHINDNIKLFIYIYIYIYIYV
jgi:hypothetical protein